MLLFRNAQECGYVYEEWEGLCKFSLTVTEEQEGAQG